MMADAPTVFRKGEWRSAVLAKLVAKIAVIIFAVEFFIMQAFDAWVPNLGAVTEGMADAILLTLIASPIIYGLVALPFVRSARIASEELQSKLEESDRLLQQNIGLQASLREASEGIAIAHEQTLQQAGADLHDGPTQQLSFVMMRLDSIASTAGIENNDLNRIRGVLAAAMHELRTICMKLSMPQLDDLCADGVARLAIAGHAEVDGQPVVLVVENAPPSLCKPRKVCLYRIIQEALANVRKHSGSTSVAVKLKGDSAEERLHIEIADNGTGFDPAKTKHGLGLSGMRARVHALGGQFKIEHAPDSGTKVIAQI